MHRFVRRNVASQAFLKSKYVPFLPQAKLGIPSRETVATEARHLATKIEELEWRMLQVEVVG